MSENLKEIRENMAHDCAHMIAGYGLHDAQGIAFAISVIQIAMLQMETRASAHTLHAMHARQNSSAERAREHYAHMRDVNRID